MRWTGRRGQSALLPRLVVGCIVVLCAFASRPTIGQEKVQLFVDEVRFKGFSGSMGEIVEPWSAALAAEVSGALEAAPRHSPVTLENLKAQLGKERLKATMACEDSNCVNRIVENFGCSETLFPVVRYISRKQAQVSVTHTADGEKVASRGPLVVPPTYEALTGALRALSREVMGLQKAKGGGFAVTPHAPIPEVTGPSDFRGAAGGMSFGEVDVEELESYDVVARYDEGDASPEEKARKWEGLAGAHPTYRDQALARAAEWREFERRRAAAERARKARAAAMAKDWKKLSRLLDLSVVSDEDKQRWAEEFVMAYGTRDNPYLTRKKPSEGPKRRRTVRVSTTEDFLDAIAADTLILLAPGTYDLSKVKHRDRGPVRWRQPYWHDHDDFDVSPSEREVVIVGVERLTIRGAGMGRTRIVTPYEWADVLGFEQVVDVRLEEVTMGHDGVAQGTCGDGADVVWVADSTGLVLSGVDLFGSGYIGLHAQKSRDILVRESVIRECVHSLVRFWEVQGAVFEGSWFTGQHGHWSRAYYGNDNDSIVFRACRWVDNDFGRGEIFYSGGKSPVRLSGCTLRKNKASSLADSDEMLILSDTPVDGNTFANGLYERERPDIK